MKNHIPTPLEICEDCLFLLANGEGTDDAAEALAARWPHGTITLGSLDEEVSGEGGFSWQSCDGCGSTFGGDRYPATGWTEE